MRLGFDKRRVGYVKWLGGLMSLLIWLREQRHLFSHFNMPMITKSWPDYSSIWIKYLLQKIVDNVTRLVNHIFCKRNPAGNANNFFFKVDSSSLFKCSWKLEVRSQKLIFTFFVNSLALVFRLSTFLAMMLQAISNRSHKQKLMVCMLPADHIIISPSHFSKHEEMWMNHWHASFSFRRQCPTR